MVKVGGVFNKGSKQFFIPFSGPSLIQVYFTEHASELYGLTCVCRIYNLIECKSNGKKSVSSNNYGVCEIKLMTLMTLDNHLTRSMMASDEEEIRELVYT